MSLITCVENGQIDKVKYLIEECECNPHADYALQYVALNGHLEIVLYLIEEQGCTPHVYSEKQWDDNGHLDIVKYWTT